MSLFLYILGNKIQFKRNEFRIRVNGEIKKKQHIAKSYVNIVLTFLLRSITIILS